MPQTLGQVIALESDARAEANKRLGAIHKNAQKPGLFIGLTQTYEPFSETAQEAASGIKRLPPKGNNVQLRAEDLLASFMGELKNAVNLALSKDQANSSARASVMVNGKVILHDVPATHLLHMEKVVADLGTFVAALPVQDPTEQWNDHENGLKRTEETFSVRDSVKKVPLVLHPPTDRHPAQVAVIEETIPEGRWTTVKYTGALSPDRKRELERRVAILKGAFRTALEEVNRVVISADPVDEAAILAGYILG